MDPVRVTETEWHVVTENHREGIKGAAERGQIVEGPDGRTRHAKSLRQTGISLRLDLGPNPDDRDIAKFISCAVVVGGRRPRGISDG
jgi:hypothetical protein